jgi:cytochrome b6-f complex iron-sulfur subunit
MADDTKPPVPSVPTQPETGTKPNAAAPAAVPPGSAAAKPTAAAQAAPPAPPAKPAAPAAAPAVAKPATPAAPAPPKPPAPPPPTANVAGRTTTPAATAAKISSRDPDDSSPLVTRRVWIGMAWGAFSAASAAALAATGRFMFPNVLNEPPQQFKVGLPSDFGMGVDERFKESNGVWIVRTADDIVHHASGFYVLNTTCTHLGCTPNFLAAESKFKCPCHGSGFRTTGINFEGPAPRPLERNRIVLADDGQILIDKSRKFQYELGQWIDPEAFLTI